MVSNNESPITDKQRMIEFSRFELANGLKVIVHEDDSTPMAAVNVLYDVGARDESPDKTGFAHLFEHLMFGGSVNVPDFDDPIQLAGGENNAFTNNDITNFYDTVPAQNIETLFWLESDRMLSLNFSRKVLNVQRKVVMEEFKETCLNEPYGDMWHLLSDLAYKNHPYRWPVIGLEPSHIEGAKMKDVKSFFFKYYRPNNAILTVSGNVKTEAVRALAEKWFGDIPRGEVPPRNLPAEPAQTEFRQLNKEANVPVDALYMAFRMAARGEPDFYVADLLSDILCTGPSSRLYRRLLKERQLFSSIDCFVSASFDPGLFLIEGKPAEGVSLEAAAAAIWEELDALKRELIDDHELQKIKNKAESNLIFSEMSALNKAINLAFFELLGDADIINQEAAIYQNISAADLHRVAQALFRKENCSQLCYIAKQEAAAV